MKFFIAVVVCLSFIATAHAQVKDCSKFKTGTFKMITEEGTFILKRTDSLQVESKIGEKIEMEFLVKWVDSCTYTLFPTKKTFKKFPDLPKDGLLTVTIIETKPKSYVQTTTSNFADFKFTYEITLID
jgi:hypothetical protein